MNSLTIKCRGDAGLSKRTSGFSDQLKVGLSQFSRGIWALFFFFFLLKIQVRAVKTRGVLNIS